MKNGRWLVTCMALALAGMMAFTGVSWAQCRGYGPGGQNYQTDQTGWRGCGQGYANCPNYTGAGYCPQGGRNSAWGAGNYRGRGYNCPYNSATQTTATPAAPATQTPQ